jgi:cell division protein FtsL
MSNKPQPWSKTTAKSMSSTDYLLFQLESFTDEELNIVAMILFGLLVLCAVGMVSVYYQCRRLQRTIIDARERQRDRERRRRQMLMAKMMKSKSKQQQQKHNFQVQRELQAELREMKQIQTQVRQQATMLQKFCALKYAPLNPPQGPPRILSNQQQQQQHETKESSGPTTFMTTSSATELQKERMKKKGV